ncbi:hypothetical protein NE237_018096 [Protea cynaroides]|uniref:Uncharacterized protein n=1 Tax=Protea cynaroides TaxID=273540 RepID=A0A9Q0K9B7_9MAGN|nr:hypothetical protein NE237_018096 [Protea cynaroides]
MLGSKTHITSLKLTSLVSAFEVISHEPLEGSIDERAASLYCSLSENPNHAWINKPSTTSLGPQSLDQLPTKDNIPCGHTPNTPIPSSINTTAGLAHSSSQLDDLNLANRIPAQPPLCGSVNCHSILFEANSSPLPDISNPLDTVFENPPSLSMPNPSKGNPLPAYPTHPLSRNILLLEILGPSRDCIIFDALRYSTMGQVMSTTPL